MNRWVYVVMSFSVVLGSTYIIFTGGIKDILGQHNKIKNYKMIKAEIISSEVKRGFRRRKGRNVAEYEPSIQYKYEINGKEYNSHQVTPLKKYGYNWSKRVVMNYPVGKFVEAYYDPQNPSNSFLIKKYRFLPYGHVLFFMLFLMFAVLMSVFALTEYFTNREPMQRENGWFEIKPTIKDNIRLFALIVASVIWHSVGIVLSGHYFMVASRPYGWIPIMGACAYEIVGFIPLHYLFRYWSLKNKVNSVRMSVDQNKF